MKKKADGLHLVYAEAKDAGKGRAEAEKNSVRMEGNTVFLRVEVRKDARCTFSYSHDGKDFKKLGEPFTAAVGRWKGAKVGLFCSRTTMTNEAGFVDFDWFRIEPFTP